MSDDLVERLLGKSWYTVDSAGKRWADDAPRDAAAALLEARAEIARLREALSLIAVMGFDENDKVARRIGELAVMQARAALAPRDAKQGDA